MMIKTAISKHAKLFEDVKMLKSDLLGRVILECQLGVTQLPLFERENKLTPGELNAARERERWRKRVEAERQAGQQGLF